ncbi:MULTISPECIES: DUF3349 domain-containing protein [unclassified Frankia]|uniref:DUF3349 domain-containing protein n=1 Tax=unclassified Frankia TaxID=2632575 RepID=UPI002AD25757|nr:MULTISPECIES: DUF3349 domain-containing protein [unclassified Frankia]
MALPAFLQRIIDWVRQGYPEGLPKHDYIALFAVLGRQLSTADLERVADELALSGQLATADDPHEVVRQAVSAATNGPVDEAAVARVEERLRAAGWDITELPPR